MRSIRRKQKQQTKKEEKQKRKLCWCGSGKVQRQCHDHPSYQEKPKVSEVLSARNSSYSKDKCHVPDEYHNECTTGTIRAHTVSKSSHLKSIANNGHVMTFNTDFSSLEKTGGVIKAGKTGINKASVFNGFCSKHDKELFEAIDDGMMLTDEHIFLNHYRTLAREMYLKESNDKFNASTLLGLDKGMSLIDQIAFQDFVKVYASGNSLGFRDLKSLKENMDKKLVDSEYGTMKFYALLIDKIPEIMSSCVWVASQDIEGNTLVDLGVFENVYNSISVSTLSFDGNKGIILFSWFEEPECPECIKFIQSLINLSKEELNKSIIYWLFAVNENIFFSPTWWNSLNKEDRDILENIYNYSLMGDYRFTEYKKLKSVIDWNIIDHQTNIKELE